MNWRWLLGSALAAGAGALVYGALVETHRLRLVRCRLGLRLWPEALSGLRVALLADLHLRDKYTLELAQRALQAAADDESDLIVIAGDFVGYWKPESEGLLDMAFNPLKKFKKPVLAVPGNHDHWGGGISRLEAFCEGNNIRLLRNESWFHEGVHWMGVDSTNAGKADPFQAMNSIGQSKEPAVVIWHEPDSVKELPWGAALMLAGHSHGGQFLTPWGWAPKTTRNGRRYRWGFYPQAPTPLYVTCGLATTGPPSRLFCPPEVVILSLEAG